MNNHSLETMLPTLKNVSIFGGLSEADISGIFNQCTVVSYKAGDILIREGTPATEIYLVLTGTIKIVLQIDNDPFEVVRFGSGDCLGETSVIGVLEHSASAVCVTDASFLVLSRKFLMDVFRENKTMFSMLLLNIARELARRLHNTDKLLLKYVKKSGPDLLKSGIVSEAQ